MHTLKLTADEVESLREFLDDHVDDWEHNPNDDGISNIRYKIAIIRGEPLYK